MQGWRDKEHALAGHTSLEGGARRGRAARGEAERGGPEAQRLRRPGGLAARAVQPEHAVCARDRKLVRAALRPERRRACGRLQARGAARVAGQTERPCWRKDINAFAHNSALQCAGLVYSEHAADTVCMQQMHTMHVKACSPGSVSLRAHRGGRHAMAATGPGVHSAAACAPDRLRRLTPPPASATASSRPPALHATASARPASCVRAHAVG
jgi:hypothetical protein